MIHQKRSGRVRVWLALAIPVLLSATGCIQAQRRGIEGNLAEARVIREEVAANPRAGEVKTELDQSVGYQEKAEAYIAKSRKTTSVELKGVADRYADWAVQMSELSLKKAQEAKTKLEGGASPAAAPEKTAAQEEGSGAQGPPGPLTAAEEAKQAQPAPRVEEKPLAEESTAGQGAPERMAGSTAGKEIIDPAREDLQGPQGPLKVDSAGEEQPPAAQTAPASDQASTAQSAPAESAAAEQAPAPQPQGEVQPPAKAQEPISPPDTEPAASPKDLYGRALALYQGGDYPASRRLFLAFLAQHPGHRLAVNSQYWIGETYYAEAEYVLALGAFEAVINQYPEGAKVPDGMVKMGLSEMKLGRLRQARQALETCLQKYPSSEAAQVARRYLEKLDQ